MCDGIRARADNYGWRWAKPAMGRPVRAMAVGSWCEPAGPLACAPRLPAKCSRPNAEASWQIVRKSEGLPRLPAARSRANS